MKDEEVRPELWINPIDKHGEPVDATVMEIAKRAWPAVIAIGRERRMYDVSWLRDVDIVPSDTVRTSQNMTRAVAAILERGTFPVILGGDHSITFPAVRAFKVPSLTVVHFDAHLDSYGSGNPNLLEHGGWVQQVGKLPGIKFVQIGMRGIANDAGGVNAAQQHDHHIGAGSPRRTPRHSGLTPRIGHHLCLN
jgi:arginase family enzyme